MAERVSKFLSGVNAADTPSKIRRSKTSGATEKAPSTPELSEGSSPLQGLLKAFTPLSRANLFAQRSNLQLVEPEADPTDASNNGTPFVVKTLKSKSAALFERKHALKAKQDKVDKLQNMVEELDKECNNLQPKSIFNLDIDGEINRLLLALDNMRKDLQVSPLFLSLSSLLSHT